MNNFYDLLATEDFFEIKVVHKPEDKIYLVQADRKITLDQESTLFLPVRANTAFQFEIKTQSIGDIEIWVDSIAILPKLSSHLNYDGNKYQIGNASIPFLQWYHQNSDGCRLYS